MAREVLLTGANRGIGLEFARQLAARGDRVVATCRNPAAASELAALDVQVETLDVVGAASIERIAALYEDRNLDLLINNAGVGVGHRPLGKLDYEEMGIFYATNAVGPLRLIEALLPALRRGEYPTVVSLTSRVGSIQDNTSGGSYAYRASKAALNAITKSLAIDLAEEGFTCVVLHPGWVQTDMGGASAPLPTDQSVAGMLRVLEGLSQEDSGGFFDYTGESLPW
jgi:NAD(P)-dependent dehydrogenase (short-subunit alcohol dehydrogenase family)